jgi:hypothetical protein
MVVGVGGGAGGAVVEVVVVVACSASSIRRIFTSGDSARVMRGAVPLWPFLPCADATTAGPAVAASTVAPGRDTIRPKRAIVRLAGRRAFSRALWRAFCRPSWPAPGRAGWRAARRVFWRAARRAFWRASCRRAERLPSVWRGSPVMVVWVTCARRRGQVSSKRRHGAQNVRRRSPPSPAARQGTRRRP